MAASKQFLDVVAEQQREEQLERHRRDQWVNSLSPEARAAYEEKLALIRAMTPAERAALLREMNEERVA